MQAGQARHAGAKMVVSSKEVGPNRFRETFGRYYEDFEPGHIYEHRPCRTITQQDNIWFTLLTMNKHPIHFDDEYAKHSEFGRCLVASPLTVAIIVGMSVSDVSQKARKFASRTLYSPAIPCRASLRFLRSVNQNHDQMLALSVFARAASIKKRNLYASLIARCWFQNVALALKTRRTTSHHQLQMFRTSSKSSWL
jgi:acyl dehydratase